VESESGNDPAGSSLNGEGAAMGLLALAMFVGLFFLGEQILGYADPGGMVQLALIATFIFGIICGKQTGS
jgi:ascorbate-specific PTS system EIIC-type component UlaA